MDWQLAIVVTAAAAAALYTARRVLAQFRRPEDEAAACDGCPANPARPGVRR